jgi:hypothetical protein
MIRGFGRPSHPVMLTAWKEERVVIGSELHELPPAGQWKPIGGRKSYQVQMPAGTPDDINIKTADGPTPAGETEIVEARPTVIPKERMREIIYVDLSKVANRSLADDVADDGQGGWTDEGPDKDMRRLPTGDQVIGGMPFRHHFGEKYGLGPRKRKTTFTPDTPSSGPDSVCRWPACRLTCRRVDRLVPGRGSPRSARPSAPRQSP